MNRTPENSSVFMVIYQKISGPQGSDIFFSCCPEDLILRYITLNYKVKTAGPNRYFS